MDLSTLSEKDLDALRPILAALSLDPAINGGDGTGVGEEEEGGGGGALDDQGIMEDEENLLEILRQMDAAEGVADDLEGKLDRLLEELAGVEEGMINAKEQEQEQEQGEEEEQERKGEKVLGKGEEKSEKEECEVGEKREGGRG